MTLAEYLARGNNVNDLYMCQVGFRRRTLRSGNELSIGRFEGLNDEGNAIVRYNGVQENSWYLPWHLPPKEVEVIQNNGEPVPYEARSMNQ